MTAALQYDIGIVGEDRLRRSMRSIERELYAHAQRAERVLNMGQPGGYRVAARQAGPRTQVMDAMRGFEQIGKAARAADLKMGRERIAAERRTNQQIVREREKALRQEERAQKQSLAKQSREVVRSAEHNARLARNAFGRVMGGAGRVAGIVGGLAGGFGVYNAVQSSLGAGMAATQLANQAFGNPGETRNRSQLRGSIMGQTNALASSTGISRDKILGTMSSFVAISGDLKGAQSITPGLLDLADALGIEDTAALGSGAAQIKDLLERNKVKGDTSKMTMAVMRQIGSQTKVGSVEFNQLVSEMPKIIGSAAQFAGDPAKLMGTLGGMTQLAIKGGAAGPAEAATAAARLPTDVIQNAKRFQAAGVDVFTDKTHQRIKDPLDIIEESIIKTKGNLSKLTPMYGLRSRKLINPFIKAYAEGGNTEEEKKASLDNMMAPFRATMSEADVKAGAEFTREDPQRKMARVMEKLSITIGDELVPQVEKLAKGLDDAIPDIQKFSKSVIGVVNDIEKHPLSGIGMLIGAAITKDLAAAKLGDVVTKSLASALAGKATIGALSMTVGSVAIAAAAVSLALDQAKGLNKDLGGSGDSLNPFADKTGKFSGKSVARGAMDLAQIVTNPIGAISQLFDKDSIGSRFLRSGAEDVAGIAHVITDPVAQADRKGPKAPETMGQKLAAALDALAIAVGGATQKISTAGGGTGSRSGSPIVARNP